MKQDWSKPFSFDMIHSIPGFCVYCPTEEDGVLLYNATKDSGALVCRFSALWSPAYPCYRFEYGTIRNRGSVRAYEEWEEWRDLPKFTFVAPRIELPELEIPDAGALF